MQSEIVETLYFGFRRLSHSLIYTKEECEKILRDETTLLNSKIITKPHTKELFFRSPPSNFFCEVEYNEDKPTTKLFDLCDVEIIKQFNIPISEALIKILAASDNFATLKYLCSCDERRVYKFADVIMANCNSIEILEWVKTNFGIEHEGECGFIFNAFYTCNYYKLKWLVENGCTIEPVPDYQFECFFLENDTEKACNMLEYLKEIHYDFTKNSLFDRATSLATHEYNANSLNTDVVQWIFENSTLFLPTLSDIDKRIRCAYFCSRMEFLNNDIAYGTLTNHQIFKYISNELTKFMVPNMKTLQIMKNGIKWIVENISPDEVDDVTKDKLVTTMASYGDVESLSILKINNFFIKYSNIEHIISAMSRIVVSDEEIYPKTGACQYDTFTNAIAWLYAHYSDLFDNSFGENPNELKMACILSCRNVKIMSWFNDHGFYRENNLGDIASHCLSENKAEQLKWLHENGYGILF